MAYDHRYKIKIIYDGSYQLYERDGERWLNIGKPFGSKEGAEQALRRVVNEAAWFYDENGEEV